jgi:hypothetical protein
MAMRGIVLGLLAAFSLLTTTAHAQKKRGGGGGGGATALLQEQETDSTGPMTAQDSASFRARTTASQKPFNECKGQAFQTCASGELEARLSSDGIAYGILFTRNYDGKSLYLWRIARGPSGGGGGKGRGGGGGGGGRGAKRRGG